MCSKKPQGPRILCIWGFLEHMVVMIYLGIQRQCLIIYDVLLDSHCTQQTTELLLYES